MSHCYQAFESNDKEGKVFSWLFVDSWYLITRQNSIFFQYCWIFFCSEPLGLIELVSSATKQKSESEIYGVPQEQWYKWFYISSKCFQKSLVSKMFQWFSLRFLLIIVFVSMMVSSFQFPPFTLQSTHFPMFSFNTRPRLQRIEGISAISIMASVRLIFYTFGISNGCGVAY